MRIHVDRSLCDLHGQCVAAAPKLFWFDESGELQCQEDPPESAAGRAADAASVCPMAAIEVTS